MAESYGRGEQPKPDYRALYRRGACEMGQRAAAERERAKRARKAAASKRRLLEQNRPLLSRHDLAAMAGMLGHGVPRERVAEVFGVPVEFVAAKAAADACESAPDELCGEIG